MHLIEKAVRTASTTAFDHLSCIHQQRAAPHAPCDVSYVGAHTCRPLVTDGMALAICTGVVPHPRPQAEGGYAPAQRFLADRFMLEDIAKSLHWRRRAAVQGDPRSQMLMALFYRMGASQYEDGLTVDFAESAKWLQRTTEHITTLTAYSAKEETLNVAYKAAEVLGSMYWTGSGVGQDDAKAARYFLLATEKSKKYAQYMMGRIYAEGELRTF